MTPVNIVVATATVLTLGIVSINGLGIRKGLELSDPPVIVTKAEVLTKEVKEGGIFRYRLTVHKRQNCAAQYDMLFHSPASGDLKAAALARDGGKVRVNDGPTPRVFSMALPKSVTAGSWVYRIIGRCQLPGEPWVWPIPHPAMKFTVVP